MVETQAPGQEIPRRLLSDDELAELMEAAYRASGEGLSKAEMERGFEALVQRLPPPSRPRVWAGPLAMAALLLIGLLPWAFGPKETGGGVKGLDPGLPVALTGYVLGSGGRLVIVGDDAVQPGDTIVFKVALAASGFVAIAVAEGEGMPIIRFESGNLDPGDGRIVEKDAQAYAYRVDGEEPRIRVCALAGATEAELAALTAALHEHFPRLAETACVTATVALP